MKASIMIAHPCLYFSLDFTYSIACSYAKMQYICLPNNFTLGYENTPDIFYID